MGRGISVRSSRQRFAQAKMLLYILAVCLGNGGCYFSPRLSAPSDFPHLAARNFSEDSIRCVDDCRFKRIAYKHAEAAWREFCAAHSDNPHSWHYHDGFREGFVDFLDAGGNGEPPLVPPFRYRLIWYKNAEGVKAIEDWYAGFRHGAYVASQSGLRELIVVPLSAPVSLTAARVEYSSAPPQHTLPDPKVQPAPPAVPAPMLPTPQTAPAEKKPLDDLDDPLLSQFIGSDYGRKITRQGGTP